MFISNSEKGMVIRFIKSILYFLIPILVIIGSVLYPFYRVAYISGEIKEADDVIKLQWSDRRIIYGMGYNEQEAYYKYVNTNYHQAEIIALGTSRVMQFKSDYFYDEFYNGGGSVRGNYQKYVNFLKALEYKPKVILVGLDSWNFNRDFNQMGNKENDTAIGMEIERSRIGIVRQIIKDWCKGKWKLKDIYRYPDNLGFNGMIRDTGFRYDGSYYYGDLYRKPLEIDIRFSEARQRMEDGIEGFNFGDNIDGNAVKQIEDLLEYCSESDIEVIAFLTPYAPSIYKEMVSSGKYEYINIIMPSIENIFKSYNYELYDFLDGGFAGLTDAYYLDGFHGSEIVYAKMIETMINSGSHIQEYINADLLRDMLNNAYSELSFINPNER